MAILLCGSGFKDGSEIREAVGVLWALSQQSVGAQCFAPDGEQADVVNGLSGKPMAAEKRNMLIESARIARGDVLPITQLDVRQFTGLIIPGGFGVAKNLCNFASLGSKGTVCADVTKVLEAFLAARKPVGAVCIAPAVLALAFKGRELELTVGPTSEASQEIEKLGHKHFVCRPDRCHVDSTHAIVSTPAYMYDKAPLHEIFDGIRMMVAEMANLVKQS